MLDTCGYFLLKCRFPFLKGRLPQKPQVPNLATHKTELSSLSSPFRASLFTVQVQSTLTTLFLPMRSLPHQVILMSSLFSWPLYAVSMEGSVQSKRTHFSDSLGKIYHFKNNSLVVLLTSTVMASKDFRVLSSFKFFKF